MCRTALVCGVLISNMFPAQRQSCYRTGLEPGGGESETCGKAKLQSRTWFYFCLSGAVERICMLSEIDDCFAHSRLPFLQA